MIISKLIKPGSLRRFCSKITTQSNQTETKSKLTIPNKEKKSEPKQTNPPNIMSTVNKMNNELFIMWKKKNVKLYLYHEEFLLSFISNKATFHFFQCDGWINECDFGIIIVDTRQLFVFIVIYLSVYKVTNFTWHFNL